MSPMPCLKTSIALPLAVILLGLVNRAEAQLGDRSIPSNAYFAAFGGMRDGEYRDAVKVFQDEWRSASRVGLQRWIDSICHHAMMGECYYEMGQFDEALEHYTAALRLYLAYPEWMIRVTFPPVIAPASSWRVVPWGNGSRGAKIGAFPQSVLIGLGHVNVAKQYREGGIAHHPELKPINANEIVRCTALAIRRRTELLGPLTRYDPLTVQLVATLTQRPALPNHWGQTWIDVLLGLALVASGKDAEAIPLLSRGTVAGGQYDHPLTSMALFELGRLAVNRGDLPAANNFFIEASISAFHFGSPEMIEESLRWGAQTHLAVNGKGMFPPLGPAAAWARTNRLRQLEVSMLLCSAESFIEQGQPAPAVSLLGEAEAKVGRRTMGSGRIGATFHYLQAAVAYQSGRADNARAPLASALGYLAGGSIWAFQVRQLDHQFASSGISIRGPITPRDALGLYDILLRDPTPSDWALRPMESLGMLTTSRPASYEHWFLVAIHRKDFEKAMEVADRARRHRFLSQTRLGGRLLALRWILEAPEILLSNQTLIERQGLLADYPAYGPISKQAAQLRKELAGMPLSSDDALEGRRQRETVEKLALVSERQEAILREMALRRQTASLVFPPLRTTKDIRQSLPEGTVLLVFFQARGAIHAFLANRDNYDHWQVQDLLSLARKTTTMLQAMGLHEQNREIPLKDLADTTWQTPAAEVLDGLLEGSQADFSRAFPELVIVPDGFLWYVPFETLQVKVPGKGLRPLISRCRIRFAPTASLAIPDPRRPSPTDQTVVIMGRLHPKHDAETTEQAYRSLANSVARTEPLRKGHQAGPSSLIGSVADQWIVFDDMHIERDPFDLTPASCWDRGRPGGSLRDWMTLPWAGPRTMILPGFHTPSEDAMKRIDASTAGDDLFLTLCGLMSSGTKTILISRWRPGGQSSFDLVREFAQELPFTSPSDSLQRAVLLTASTRLDLSAEPRINGTLQPQEETPRGSHPFFWAGHMLVDTGVLPEASE